MKKVYTLDEYMNDRERISPEEREAILFEAELIRKMVEIRKELNLSQRELSERSGTKQPAIARMERMRGTPQINTVLKLLVSMGYTLRIVPIENRRA